MIASISYVKMEMVSTHLLGFTNCPDHFIDERLVCRMLEWLCNIEDRVPYLGAIDCLSLRLTISKGVRESKHKVSIWTGVLNVHEEVGSSVASIL